MSELSAPSRHGPGARRKPLLGWLVTAFVLALLAGTALGPINQSAKNRGRTFQGLQRTHVVALAMFSYANDHDGQYPDGRSSTEVFQKLLDGKYLSDPEIFFLKMPGKTAGEAGQQLKPENVSFDVIVPLDNNTPDNLPAVFSTGYRVDLKPGGAAVPFRMSTSWAEASRSLAPDWGPGVEGIAVAWKNNGSRFSPLQPPDSEHPHGAIPEFIPKGIDIWRQVYHQLTPEGVLP